MFNFTCHLQSFQIDNMLRIELILMHSNIGRFGDMCSRQRRASPVKYINKLAMIQEHSILEKESQELHKVLKYKIKAVNLFAQSDPDFLPNLPNSKEDLESTMTGFNNNSSIEQLSSFIEKEPNPEIYQRLLKEGTREHYYSSISQEAENPMEKSVILRVGNQYFFKEQMEYCFDCDQRYEQKQNHECSISLFCQEKVNQRLIKLKELGEMAPLDKFLIFIDCAITANSSPQLQSTIVMLKNTRSIKFSDFEELIKKRVINLMSKKLGALLNMEETD